MRKILAMAGAMILTGSISYAQDVTPDLSAGTQALLFTFSGLSNLGANDFVDGGVGYKYFISDGTAVRASVMLSKSHNVIPANPSGTDGSNDATTIGFSAALERHMGMGRVSPYYGAGASFATASSESKTAIVSPATTGTTTKNAAFSGYNQFGIFGHGGFEFFLRREVSLGGEYRLAWTHTGYKDQQVITGATTTTTKLGSANNLGIASQGVLTLAVYFGN